MVVVAISMADETYNKIEATRNGFHDGKAILFKRSPFYVKLLLKGLESMEKDNNGRITKHTTNGG